MIKETANWHGIHLATVRNIPMIREDQRRPYCIPEHQGRTARRSAT